MRVSGMSVVTLAVAVSRCTMCLSFSPPAHRMMTGRVSHMSSSSSSSSESETSVESQEDPLGLTPELRKMTNAFASIPEEKTRYKQLLYMADKMPTADPKIMIPENKVPGCLSTVYIDCMVDDANQLQYVGECDGLLTKGLVALLIRGLSGCTAEQISKVNPEFINAAKISQSLTPGRNNGFLNMLAVMKKKAAEAKRVDTSAGEDNTNGEVTPEEEEEVGFERIEGKPMYNAIMSRLISVLKPTDISLVDNSHQHAGHAGNKGWEESGESHFSLDIVAEAFDGLNLAKRHQLIYMLLGEEMPKIHALQIMARTPQEVN